MNKLLFVVLVLFFVAAIVFGLNAIFEDVRSETQAKLQCPPQEFPDKKICPTGTRMVLIKNQTDCFEFACK